MPKVDRCTLVVRIGWLVDSTLAVTTGAGEGKNYCSGSRSAFAGHQVGVALSCLKITFMYKLSWLGASVGIPKALNQSYPFRASHLSWLGYCSSSTDT